MESRRRWSIRWQRIGLGGAVLAALGLIWDAVLHARNPALAQHEVASTFSNPAHLLIAAGLVATLVGQAAAVVVTVRHRAGRRLLGIGLGLLLGGLGLVLPTAALREAAAAAAQRAAAGQLVADTAAGIAQYRDPGVAIADGYSPATSIDAPVVEWVAAPTARVGRVLYTRHPERLMYLTSGRGPVLAGAMFVLSAVDAVPPATGGPLVHWHRHLDLCFLPNGTIAGTNGYGSPCPAGSAARATPLMLHVWIVPNPAGPFADDLSPGAIESVVNG